MNGDQRTKGNIFAKGNEVDFSVDLRDLPADARAEMEFIFAGHVHEVLRAAIPGIGENGRLRIAA